MVAYHGTDINFTVFDINKTSSINDLGKGHYFTNNKEDLQNNYLNIKGGDIQNKIESLAFEYFENMGHTENDLYDNEFADDYNSAYDKAEEYYLNNLNSIGAYLRILNPIIIDEKSGLKKSR